MRVSARLKNAFYLATAWLGAYLPLSMSQFPDPDLWGRLSVAALYFKNGQFPYYDVFSYTAPNAHWVDHEWLTGFILYPVLTQLGEPALVLLKAGLLLGLLGMLLRLHTRAYQTSPLYFLYGSLLLSSIYGVGFSPTMRSHVFSFVLFIGFLYVLERIRLGQRSLRWLAVFPILGVFWGNAHGGFIMGILLMGLYGLSAAIQQRSAQAVLPYAASAFGLFALLALFNPYGIPYIGFLFKAWAWDRSHIGEWTTLRIGYPAFWTQQALLLGTLAILVLYGIISTIKRLPHQAEREALSHSEDATQSFQTVPLAPVLVLLWLCFMAWKSLRMQPFLAFGAIAYAPLVLKPISITVRDYLSSLLPPNSKTRARLTGTGITVQGLAKTTLPVLIFLSALTGLGYLHSKLDLLRVSLADEMTQGNEVTVRYPLAALQYLEQSPFKGNLSVRFGLGEFAYWRLYPRFKVSMDGRYEEVYTQAQFLENDALYNRQKPEQAIEAANVIGQTNADFVLIETDMPNLATLRESGQWQVLYEDRFFILFGRASLKPYIPPRPIVTGTITSISDWAKPEDLARFRR